MIPPGTGSLRHTLSTRGSERGNEGLKCRGSLKNYTSTYMCVAALAACSGGRGADVQWTFADGRSCTEANVVDVAIRDADRTEIARAACTAHELRVDRDGIVIVEAMGLRGTVLYRARALIEPGDEAEPVVLRFVGGDP